MTNSSPDSVFHGYAGPDSVYDELVGAGDVLRPHWQTFAHCIDEIGIEEIQHRWREAQLLIRENGVTYNVYGDPRGLDRPWQLDPIPLVISAQESKHLRQGLHQRGRLLEAILNDLYGPQRLLHDGAIPPELVFGNPGFLRSLHGVKQPGGRYLHLVALDLGRARDGSVCVLGDRTQAPSGAGYALENRIVLSRMLPEVFKECNVQRLALFFRTLRDTLRNLAPHNRDNPRSVLLTPGPMNETYFEHAYLARYLGYILAEGGDLTVRDNRVYLKLLDGLQPVDILWRRLDDDFCDPLELRHDSFLGIPGLVQAVRAGNIVVANALGTGLVETPALIPFLPDLCKHILGEDLIIPSVPTYWCGNEINREHVIANLHRMVLKAAFRSMRIEPIFGYRLTREQRSAWTDKIRTRPWAFVGQDILELSTAPVLTERGLQPRHLVFRAYLAATDTKGFTLMPGGLTRITAAGDTMNVSLQKGGGSKDTWVLSDGPVAEFSLLRPSSRPVELSRGGNDLPSRAADNLYWMGRYVQRTEDTIRLLRGIVVRLTEKSGLAEAPELPALLRTLTKLSQTAPGFIGEGADARLAAPEEELYSIIYQRDRVGSLAYDLANIHRIASTVRDRISLDMWRVLHTLRDMPTLGDDPGAWPTLSDALDLLNQHVITLAGFAGIAMESMTRGHGWRFLDMGRKIERAQHIIGLINSTLTTVTPAETPLMEALLEIADSAMTFRRRYLSSVHCAPVLDLLLADESNPRSLVYQLVSLRDNVEMLPKEPGTAGRSPEQRLVLALLTSVQLADPERLATHDEHNRRPMLDDFLTRLEKDLPLLSEVIAHHYLAHLQTSRQLASMRT